MAKKDKGSSVYKVIELVGTSSTSWADAARNAVKSASKTIRDIRVAEVSKLDVKVDKNGEMVFRAKMKLSFKYHGE
jgi:flavin-binding protein dodecin